MNQAGHKSDTMWEYSRFPESDEGRIMPMEEKKWYQHKGYKKESFIML